MLFERVNVEALAYTLPPQVMTTAAIEAALSPLYQRLGIRPGWLEAITGIQERRFWEPGVAPSDAATLAARAALDEARIASSDVDVLVSSSVCRDFLEPSVACLVHGNLRLKSACLNFDVGNACLGFLSAMSVVANLIEQGACKVGMVVAGEGSRVVTESTLERLRRPEANASTYRDNLATLTLGSAAVAMILRRADDSRTGHRLRGGVFQAATEHNRLCLGTETGMVTDPPKLLAEGVALARRTWDQSRVELGWDHPQIAEYALHQVGKANHEALIKNLSLPDAKALRVYTGLGNVGAAGVPITLALAVEQGRLRTGQTAALMGIGSGLNVAMMRVDW